MKFFAKPIYSYPIIFEQERELRVKQKELIRARDIPGLKGWLGEYEQIVEWYNRHNPTSDSAVMCKILLKATEFLIQEMEANEEKHTL